MTTERRSGPVGTFVGRAAQESFEDRKAQHLETLRAGGTVSTRVGRVYGGVRGALGAEQAFWGLDWSAAFYQDAAARKMVADAAGGRHQGSMTVSERFRSPRDVGRLHGVRTSTPSLRDRAVIARRSVSAGRLPEEAVAPDAVLDQNGDVPAIK